MRRSTVLNLPLQSVFPDHFVFLSQKEGINLPLNPPLIRTNIKSWGDSYLSFQFSGLPCSLDTRALYYKDLYLGVSLVSYPRGSHRATPAFY